MSKKIDPINIEVGGTYQSNTSGPFTVLEDLGSGCIEGCTSKHRLIRVKFLNTGAEKVVRYSDAARGKIRDASTGVTVGKIYQSNNFGPYEIIEDLGMNHIGGAKEPVRLFKIRFLNTGTIRTARHTHVISGDLKDPYAPSLFGIGYIGEPDYSRSDYNTIISRWRGIMSRCYYTNDTAYNSYGGAGVTVDPRWWNFANFLEDVQYLPGYQEFLKDPNHYDIDKDILQQNVPTNQKVYSKDTCQFITTHANILQSVIDYYNTPGRYFGVHYLKNRGYYVVHSRNPDQHYIGRFNDPIMAANCYNNYIKSNNLPYPINEDIPYISPEEVFKNNAAKRDMVVFVDKSKNRGD